MKLRRSNGRSPGEAGFSLVEVSIAASIVLFLVLANLSAVAFHRVSNTKEKEMGIMTDYCVHYVELARSLPFRDLKAGQPINALYDGSAGAPNIRIPASTNWISLDANYQNFHPELVWIERRNPEMRVLLNVRRVDGEDHTKHLHLEVRWDPPLGQGEKLGYSLDSLRVRDL